MFLQFLKVLSQDANAHETSNGHNAHSPALSLMIPERPVVLIVDDDEDSRVMYSAIFEHAGFRILSASDGAEGVRIARDHRPEVILMDLAMPHMDGIEATKQIRQTLGAQHATIIALSGAFIFGREGQLTKAGFDGFLRKPALPRSVLFAVISALDDRRTK